MEVLLNIFTKNRLNFSACLMTELLHSLIVIFHEFSQERNGFRQKNQEVFAHFRVEFLD